MVILLVVPGIAFLLDYYLKVSPQLNEPLYTRPRMYSGVRGAPHRLQAVRPSTRLCAVQINRLVVSKLKKGLELS